MDQNSTGQNTHHIYPSSRCPNLGFADPDFAGNRVKKYIHIHDALHTIAAAAIPPELENIIEQLWHDFIKISGKEDKLPTVKQIQNMPNKLLCQLYFRERSDNARMPSTKSQNRLKRKYINKLGAWINIIGEHTDRDAAIHIFYLEWTKSSKACGKLLKRTEYEKKRIF